jgi:ADP-heptose:LPS heptosyltransferase
MHLAVACDTPVVALFGPTDETRVGPGTERSRVLRADVDCSVCYRRDCPRRCIDAIGVDEVVVALESLAVDTKVCTEG